MSIRVTGRLPLWLAALVVSGTASCQQQAPDDLTLFGPNTSALPAADKAEIIAVLGERFPGSDEAQFSDAACGDIRAEIELADLNRDGYPETFVHWGNSCTSGMTGRSLTMFSRDRNGGLIEHFGFPSAGFTELPDRTNGYADLEFGGPGFCFGVWAMGQERYEFKCNMPQEEGGCNGQENICSTE
jgi:hypothetical protein